MVPGLIEVALGSAPLRPVSNSRACVSLFLPGLIPLSGFFSFLYRPISVLPSLCLGSSEHRQECLCHFTPPTPVFFAKSAEVADSNCVDGKTSCKRVLRSGRRAAGKCGLGNKKTPI